MLIHVRQDFKCAESKVYFKLSELRCTDNTTAKETATLSTSYCRCSYTNANIATHSTLPRTENPSNHGA